MEDLIACLYPLDEGRGGYAALAVGEPENSSRLLAAREGLPDLPGRNSRESTAPLDDNEGTITSDVHNGGLQLTFTHGPKAGPGFVLGTDSNSCDIVLPRLPFISRRHCYLTFDTERRLILRDCSTHGTSVEYDRKGGEKRRNFTWIIGGHLVLQKTREIVIKFHTNLMFRLVVSKPLYPDIYFQNVDGFIQEMSMSENLPFGALGIQSSVSTAAPSGTHTPNQDRILLKLETLGKGSFSTVSHVWDVSTGLEYASKRFHNVSRDDWRQEARLMQRMSHEHLVWLYFMTEQPTPQLVLEYLPLGNLDQQHSRQCLSADEMLDTLIQGLSALTYLHGQTPPIVHRDIKPENILVKSRDPFNIKLGDFGLSKASEDLVTFCGTATYLAPEVSKYYELDSLSDLKYTRAVDVWSFGVVIFQYIYDLPQPGKGVGLRWCKKIADRLNSFDSDGLVDLLSHMIVMEPEQRHPAKTCWENALTLERPCRSSTPTPDCFLSSQTKAPQAGSASPTEKFSTIKLYENLHRRSKRQRSTERVIDESRRSTKPFSQILSITSTSVLRLLDDIRSDGDDLGIPDSHTATLVDLLCQHFERLGVTQLKTHVEDATKRVIVTAVAEAHEFPIANLTSSDCENSTADLAEYLAEILQLMSTTSSKFSINQPFAQESRSKEDTSTDGSTGSSHHENADDDIHERLNDSTQGRDTSTASSLPVTYPSGLLYLGDDTDCPSSIPH